MINIKNQEEAKQKIIEALDQIEAWVDKQPKFNCLTCGEEYFMHPLYSAALSNTGLCSDCEEKRVPC